MSDIALRFLLANLAAAIAIILVIALRKPARAAFGARLAYSLWLLVPLAALGSLLPPRVVEIARPAPTMSASYPPPSFAPDFFPAPQVFAPADTHALPATPPTGPLVQAPWTMDPWTLGVIAWLAGALAMAAWLLRGQLRFLADARAGFAGPAIAGVFSPRIIVPADFEDRFEKSERDIILAHEKIHLDNNDARINALAALVRCLCWFNPLIHIAAHLMRVDQELACDATVVERHPRAKAVYASALLKAQPASRPLPLGCYWPAGTEHPLTERVEMLKQAAPGRVRRTAGVSALALLALGACVSTWAAVPPETRHVEAPQSSVVAANNPVDFSAVPQPPSGDPQPIRYSPQQEVQQKPVPTQTASPALPADMPIYLRGKVEKIDFRDTSYIVFLRATSITPGGCVEPSIGPLACSVPNQALWELSPANHFGDRDTTSEYLMGKTVEMTGTNTNEACTPSCHVEVTALYMLESSEVPAPPAGASRIAEFARWYDTNTPAIARGTVERIEFHDDMFDAYVRTRPRGPVPGRLYQVRSEYRFPRADIERELLGNTVTASGWPARASINTQCEPICGMYATDFELPNRARVTPSGAALNREPPPVANRLVSVPMPDAPAAFRDLFDWNAPVTIEGRITKIESSGVRASGPGDRNIKDVIWVETTSVSPASTAGGKTGTVWRIVGGGLPPPLESFIGNKVTAFGYVTKDKNCQPTCSMAHVEMSLSS